MSFREAIRETEIRVSELQAQVHEALLSKHKSPEHESAWKQAAREFHEYRSPIDDLMDRCHQEDIASDQTLREFAIAFLECDPVFFRSGYFKELLLDKLKGASLAEAEQDRLRDVLVDAVERRGQREFRRYCRLAARICDRTLANQLVQLSQDSDPSTRSRAQLMRRYVEGPESAA